ncbi:MAG: FG-GAP repeat domain-containing protein [Bryobacteraceae bacterium]
MGRVTVTAGFATAALILLPSLAQLNRDRGQGPDGATEISFLSHRLGTDHAEGIAVLDMNNDGRPDLVSGAYWYQNPGPGGGIWNRKQYRTVEYITASNTTEFVSDCGEWVVDVNHDGAPDVVTAGWQTDGLWWYENPRKPDVLWQRHLITQTTKTEGGVYRDLNGDGIPDLALAHYGRLGVIWIDFAGIEPKTHTIGGPDQDGHGIGAADIDSDGKIDVMTPNGWFRNLDANADKWEWHGDWQLGEASFPIVGHDANNDGKTDIIYGRGHSYGLYWLEQRRARQWTRHTIDESFSQIHVLKLVDLDGDGKPELLAGKRYRGHNGSDPGSYDPLVIYYYRINADTGKFSRFPISVNGTAGAGTTFVVEDLDGDGDLDVAVAGKTGVHFLENLKVDKVPPSQREKELLLDRNWPFPGEGVEVRTPPR